MEAWAQPAGPQNPKEVLTFAASRFGCCRGKGVAGLGSVGVRPGRSGEIDGGFGVGCWSCTPPHPIVAVHFGIPASAEVATALYQVVLAVLYPRTEAAKAKWLRWRDVIVN